VGRTTILDCSVWSLVPAPRQAENVARRSRTEGGQVDSPEPSQPLPVWGTATSAPSPGLLPIVVSGGDDALVRIWDLESRQLVHEPLRAHDGKINTVAVGNLGARRIVISGGSDRTLRVWDLVSGQAVGAPLEGHRRKVLAVAFGTIGDRPIVVSGGNDNTVRVWDLHSGRPLYQPFSGHDGNVTAVAMGKLRGRTVAVSAGDDGTLRVWDLAAGEQLGEPLIHDDIVHAVAVGQLGGRPIAVSGGFDNLVRAWDLEAGKQLGTLRRGLDWVNDDWINAVAVGQLGGLPIAVSGGSDQMVRVWDLDAGGPHGEPLAGHDGWVSAVALGVIRDRLVAVSGGLDKSVRVWDLDAGAPLGWPLWQESSVNAVAIAEIPRTSRLSSTATIAGTDQPTAWPVAADLAREGETGPEPGVAGGSQMRSSARRPSVRVSVQPRIVTAGEQITCRVDIDRLDAKVRGGHVELGYDKVIFEDKDDPDPDDALDSSLEITKWVCVERVELFSGGLEPGPQFVQFAVPEEAPPTAKGQRVSGDVVEWLVVAVIDRRRGRDARAEAHLIVRAPPGREAPRATGSPPRPG
jgi:WD40 repeat protein